MTRSSTQPGNLAKTIKLATLICAAALSFTSLSAQAVGLGKLELNSRLNQSLQARIDLVGLKPGEIEDLQVALGDDAAFDRQGLARDVPVALGVGFKLVSTGESTGHVIVSSKRTVREPSLVLVVELSAHGGRSLRTYSLLLSTE